MLKSCAHMTGLALNYLHWWRLWNYLAEDGLFRFWWSAKPIGGLLAVTIHLSGN